MATKQTIAIIGATESKGAAIANRLAAGSYRLVLMAEDIKKLQGLESDILTVNAHAELEISACPQEACWEADMIIFVVAEMAKAEIASKINQYATGKIVICIADPSLDTDGDLQRLLPNSKVINVLKSFSDGANETANTIISIAGNDADALGTVTQLLRNAGFHAVVMENLS